MGLAHAPGELVSDPVCEIDRVAVDDSEIDTVAVAVALLLPVAVGVWLLDPVAVEDSDCETVAVAVCDAVFVDVGEPVGVDVGDGTVQSVLARAGSVRGGERANHGMSAGCKARGL